MDNAKLLARIEILEERARIATTALFGIKSRLKDAADQWERTRDGFPVAQSLRILADDCVREWNGAVPAPQDKPLSTKEQNTLLIIIAALCNYSKMDTQDRGMANRVAKMTQEIGAEVSEDTVLRWLKKIPDAKATRMK